jgi:F0F1-type ATP synthase assembly protein I
MKNLLKKSVWYVPGIVLGAVAGYFYWKFYGCNGTCLITSNPIRTMIYFGLMGGLLNNMFKPELKNNKASGNISSN